VAAGRHTVRSVRPSSALIQTWNQTGPYKHQSLIRLCLRLKFSYALICDRIMQTERSMGLISVNAVNQIFTDGYVSLSFLSY